MRRVLIVSPHFPPANTPDLHRVRVLLPFLRECGWEAEVLAVSPQQVAAPMDPWLEDGIPPDISVHRINALGLRWAAIPGLGGLGFRAMLAMKRAGDQLLARGRFDLVYFSTTVFELHILGPRWRRKFGVPFVMDYQDPWVNDYYREHSTVRRPGGRIKFRVAEALHRWMEPRVVAAVAGVTSVSPTYPEQIEHRYGMSKPLRALVQPFPASRLDFERAKGVLQTQFDPSDGAVHWVYAGAIVPSMLRPIRALFAAVRACGDARLRENLRIHFIGTSYAGAATAKATVEELSREYGLTGTVQETTARLPYSEVLASLCDADALLAIGSDDAGYTPSKLYPYLLTGKPLLALYLDGTPAVDLLRSIGGAVCVPFSAAQTEEQLSSAIAERWIENGEWSRRVAVDERRLVRADARAAAAELVGFFEQCIA